MIQEIAEGNVLPGDVLAFDYEILTDQPDLQKWAIGKIKAEVWAHPMLDYQSSETFVLGDLELKRDVKILRVRAQVRVRPKANRPQENVQEANWAYWIVAGGAFAVGVAAAIVFRSVKKDIGVTVQRTGEVFREGMQWSVLLALIFVAYTLFARE